MTIDPLIVCRRKSGTQSSWRSNGIVCDRSGIRLWTIFRMWNDHSGIFRGDFYGFFSNRYNLNQCCGSGMFIPYPDFYPSRSQIPDPGSKNSNQREGWKKFYFVAKI
jgi:hypothetical protein